MQSLIVLKWMVIIEQPRLTSPVGESMQINLIPVYNQWIINEDASRSNNNDGILY